MAIDSRVLRVLRKLEEKKCPKLATELFSANDAPATVISAALRIGRTMGLCDYENLGNCARYWSITDHGRRVLEESK